MSNSSADNSEVLLRSSADLSGRNAPLNRRAGRLAQWTLRKRIGFAFAVIVLLVVAEAAVSIYQLREVNRAAVDVRGDAIPGLQTMGLMQRNAGEVQVCVLRALLATDVEKVKQQVAEVETLRKENDRLLADYAASISTEEDRSLFDRTKSLRDKYSAARTQVLQLAIEGKRAEALALNAEELRGAFDEFKAALDALLKYNVDTGQRLGTDILVGSTTTLRVVIIAAGLVLAFSILIALLVVVSLNRVLSRVAESLDEGASQVASAAGQVSESSQTLASGASEQASSLEETSSSLEELASMTRRNSESTEKASVLAREARQAADTGASDMRMMASAMTAIKASGDDIVKIVKTIDEIAFQTNILALNAAVEAARAGTAGAGFAVVADEVRALAQRSAQAAKETAEKVEGTIERTAQGVAISEKVGTGLTAIVEKVRKVDELIAEVNAASGEQKQGVDQINVAVGQMDKVVQSSASNSEETAAAAEELSAQSLSMRDAVSELVRLVKGQSAGKGGRTADQPSSAEGRPAMVRSRPRPTRTELSIAAYNPNGRLAAGKIDGNGRVDEEAEVEHFR